MGSAGQAVVHTRNVVRGITDTQHRRENTKYKKTNEREKERKLLHTYTPLPQNGGSLEL